MEFRVLNYFLTIVQEKSISNAAKRLHLSQPALSKQIKQLEQELGVTLFNRGYREIELTEEGLYLANRGMEILQLMNTTTSNLAKDALISGEIMIGGGETIGMQCIAKIVSKITSQHPDVKIHLHSGNGNDIIEKLDTGLIDFGIVIDPIDKRKYEYLTLPIVDHLGLLVREDHPLATKSAITPADLKNVPLFISRQTLVESQIVEWGGKDLKNPIIDGTYNLLYNASLMVKEGVAAALAIDGIINTKETNLRFIPLSPTLTAKLHVIWKKNQVFSNASALFLSKLKETLD